LRAEALGGYLAAVSQDDIEGCGRAAPGSTGTISMPGSRDKAFLRSLVLHIRDPAIRGR
jgi:hypothetical protein